MSNSFSRKIKSFLVRLFVICLFSLISFFLIYKISFLPSGYDIASEQKNSVIIKSFNTFGIGENITTVTFPSNDKGKNDDSGYELKRQVERQKVYLWLIFALLPTSVFILLFRSYVMERRYGKHY